MSSKPRVLHVVGNFQQGGSERQAVQLVRLLQQSGHFRQQVACLHAEGPLRREVEALGVAPIEFPLTSFHDMSMLRQLARLVRLLHRREVDIVQTHEFYSNVFGMLGAAIAGVPVRIAARRDIVRRSRVQAKLQAGVYRLAHAVVANGAAVKRTLVAEGVPHEKITVIHNGLDLDRVRPIETSREAQFRHAGLPDDWIDRPVVTMVANMHLPVKDHPTFLRAAQRVHTTRPDVLFVLAGAGALLDDLQSRAHRLGLGSSVFFAGGCPHVADLLALSAVCVLSSRAEGMPNAVLEYMGASRPVVATAVGAVPEIVAAGVTGFLVAPEDDATMAERISTLLGDTALADRMGKAGREVVERYFSCEAQRQATEDLYRRMIEQSRLRSR